jgi:hypothetical protein
VCSGLRTNTSRDSSGSRRPHTGRRASPRHSRDADATQDSAAVYQLDKEIIERTVMKLTLEDPHARIDLAGRSPADLCAVNRVVL